MPKDTMQADIYGDHVRLSRHRWRGHEAMISNYPGLLEAVESYTWTYRDGPHPYLYSERLGKYLHKFVLEFLYGEDKLSTMLSNGNIIEHLDNDGLNCAYDNLHVLSADYNKAKALTIDKKHDSVFPEYVTDVYYSHKKQCYQMQIVFNKDLYRFTEDNAPVESFFCLYSEFNNLYLDWLYVLECREKECFDITKFHAMHIEPKKRPMLILSEEEKDSVIIERDGEYYLRLEMEDPNRIAVVNHTAFQEIDD